VSELGGVAAFTQPGGGGSAGGGGNGVFVGPASALVGSIVLFDGTTGKLGKDASVVLSAFAKTLLDDANAGAVFTTLGVSAFAQTILDDADAATVRATIGAGTGNGNGTIIGSTGATDNLILRSDGTGGTTLQNSGLSLADEAGGVVAVAVSSGNTNVAVTFASKGTGAVGVGNGSNVTYFSDDATFAGTTHNLLVSTAATGGIANVKGIVARRYVAYDGTNAFTLTPVGANVMGVRNNVDSAYADTYMGGLQLFNSSSQRLALYAPSIATFALAAGNVVAFSSSTTEAYPSLDAGISRAAAADLAFGNGTAADFTATLKFGNARCRGRTTTAAAATTTEYPTDKDWGIHRNSNTAAVHLVYNDSGTIKSVQLT